MPATRLTEADFGFYRELLVFQASGIGSGVSGRPCLASVPGGRGDAISNSAILAEHTGAREVRKPGDSIPGVNFRYPMEAVRASDVMLVLTG